MQRSINVREGEPPSWLRNHLTWDAFHLLELADRKELVLVGLMERPKAGSRNYPRDPCAIYTRDTQELM